jgi:hypothetical protein
MDEQMTVSETLNRAADLIEERGWNVDGNGWCVNGGQPLCLEGALGAAQDMDGIRSWGTPAHRAVVEHLRDRTTKMPFRWNDDLFHAHVKAAIAAHDFSTPFDMDSARAEARENGKTEVIATLRACAVIEAAKETANARVAEASEHVRLMQAAHR